LAAWEKTVHGLTACRAGGFGSPTPNADVGRTELKERLIVS